MTDSLKNASESQEPKESQKVAMKRVARRVTLLLFGCLFLASAWLAVYALRPGPETAAGSAIVTIPKGTSLRGMTGILAAAGLLKEDVRFPLLARILGYSGRLRAGEFKLSTGRTPLQVLRQLVVALPVVHAVTIPEGLRIKEIGRIFAEGGWCDEARFLRLTSDKAFLAELGFGGLNSLEGYLFPDTYHLTRDIHGEKELIGLMTRRFREVWGQVAPSPDSAARLHEVVILASMVEKEAAHPEERPLIAGVFHNRLNKGMRLQSDPTVIYGIEDYAGNITKKHLQTPTRYNTYTISGLPAGPISNPGKAALQAALNPAPTDYLYFVGKNDGTHQFSRTLEEHNQAVMKYQRKKTGKNGKG